MSKQLFAQLFLGERGQSLADVPMIAEDDTPYPIYSDQTSPVVSQNDTYTREATSKTVQDDRLKLNVIETVPQNAQHGPSLGF